MMGDKKTCIFFHNHLYYKTMSFLETVSTEVTIGTSPIGSVQRVPEHNIHPLPVEANGHIPALLLYNVKQISFDIDYERPSEPSQTPTISQEGKSSSPIVLEPAFQPKNAKLARTFQAIETMVVGGNFPDGKLPTVSQLAIGIRCRSDYVIAALNELFARGIAVPVRGKWYIAGSQAEQDARASSHTPTSPKHPILIFGKEPPHPSSLPHRKAYGTHDAYQQLSLETPEPSKHRQLPLSRRATRPESIAENIRAGIKSLPGGISLDTLETIAKQKVCSDETVRRGLQILQNSGHVKSDGTRRGYVTTGKDYNEMKAAQHLAACVSRMIGRQVSPETAQQVLEQMKKRWTGAENAKRPLPTIDNSQQ